MQIVSLVNQVLSDLSLETVADVIIGGGQNQSSNMSGGQLKRVNIAIELVSDPVAIFLDGMFSRSYRKSNTHSLTDA